MTRILKTSADSLRGRENSSQILLRFFLVLGSLNTALKVLSINLFGAIKTNGLRQLDRSPFFVW